MTPTMTRESMTQVYHKDGSWVGFFMNPEAAEEWIATRENPAHFYGEVGKPKRPKAKTNPDGYPSAKQAAAARKKAKKEAKS
jgi:hypothetical protein